MNDTLDRTPVTADLANYTLGLDYADLPDPVIAHAKLAVLDTLACALAAAGQPVGSTVIEFVRDSGESGPASTWAGNLSVSAPTAAYVNGHLANALDYDNSLHLDTHVLPAALAVAEWRRVSGRTFLAAYLAAREVGARLMKALDGQRESGQGVSHRGWWHVGLVSPLDSALAAARLLELDPLQTRHALGIASASVGGFRRSLGTMAKSLHSGKAARDGIQAALLAQRGFTGDPEILEAPMGLISALCPDGEFDYAALYDGLGSTYTLSAPPKMKPYPSCGPAIAQIDSVLELRRTHAIDPEQVVAVRADFHPNSLFRTEAHDGIEAGFSTPYILASTLLDNEFGPNQLSEARVHDPAVRALMAKIEHDRGAPSGQVTVVLADGRELAAGSATRRWLKTWDEVSAKFEQVAEPALDSGRVDEIRAAVTELESLSDVSELSALLRRGGPAT